MNQIINSSKYWEGYKNSYSNKQHHEGYLYNEIYNKKVKSYLSNYKTEYTKLSQSYLTGLELEFYIKKDFIEKFIYDLMLHIPREYMLIESIKKKLESDTKHFFLVNEPSLKSRKGYWAVELITPTLDIRVIPYYLNVFFKLFNQYNIKTTKNCGLHIHLSTIDANNISPMVFMYFIDSFNVFEWKEREFVRSIIKEVFAYRSEDWQYVYNNVLRKCYDINFIQFSNNNHIEYRSPGGKKYFKRYNKIMKDFFSILKAYELSANVNIQDIQNNIQSRYELKKKVVNTSRLSYKEFLKLNTQNLWII